ncbi:MAG: hypothetical protein M1838_003667 [Thelocarpon superellum]|nr:MAG: hypothetical protein M1838_003667 [Thelocarpon superellum]
MGPQLPVGLTALLWSGVALVVYMVISKILAQRQYAAEAARRGAKPALVYPSILPLGFDHIYNSLKADREQRFAPFVQERFEEMNVTTLRYYVLGEEIYQTIDPKNLQAMLATQFNDFALGPERRNNFFPMLGSGIFTLDGRGWEHSRAMIRPQFARDQISDLELEERHVQNMLLALPADKDGLIDVDLQPLFFRLTLDTATEFLFGKSCDSQLHGLPDHDATENPNDDGNIFATAFDKGQSWLAMRSRFQSLYWAVDTRDFRQACKQTQAFADQFVRRALSKDRDEKELEKGGKEKYVFLDALAAQTQDPVELRSQLLNILLGGRDTTASLLGWLFYSLARKPEIFQKLRNIILDEFGTYDDPHEITFARLKSCQYLQFCNNETLRLYPVVPVNTRQAVRNTTLPRGGGPDGMSPIFVKKDQHVQYTVHAMHRRKEEWGDDANEYVPERWENKRVGWEYLPFNGGPRICPGQQFALTESSYVTVRLMQRYDRIENRDPEPMAKHNLTLTNCSGTGTKVRLHEATHI